MNILIDCPFSHNRKKLISLQERKSKITFENSDEKSIKVYQPDKCEVYTDMGCDFLLVVESASSGFFVELKGRNYEHGIKQLKSTIEHVKSTNKINIMKAYLVSLNRPISTRIQKDRFVFQRMLCPLMVMKPQQIITI